MKIDAELLNKFKNGECTPEELSWLRHYFEQNDWSLLDEELRREWEAIKNQHAPDKIAKEEVWNRLKQNQPSIIHVKVVPMRRRILRRVAAAAAIILLFGSGQFFLRPKIISSNLVEKTNNTNLPMTIPLDDGSTVWLKPKSQLVYDQAFAPEIRKVYLKGEARFDVTTDSLRPFIVETDDLQTKVLGTVFNIRALPNQETTEVILFEGKVAVSLKEKKEETPAIILHPGEKAQFQKSTRQLSKNQLVEKSKSKWKDGVIFFLKADINEVVITLENWYNISITIKNKAKITERLVHRIDTKKMTLKEVLYGINLVAKYQIKKIADNEYIVTPKD